MSGCCRREGGREGSSSEHLTRSSPNLDFGEGGVNGGSASFEGPDIVIGAIDGGEERLEVLSRQNCV